MLAFSVLLLYKDSMSQECYRNCPKVLDMALNADYAAEYASPDHREAIWRIFNRQAEGLVHECEGPIVAETKIVENKLPHYHLKRILGKKATERIIMPVYGCLRDELDQ